MKFTKRLKSTVAAVLVAGVMILNSASALATDTQTGQVYGIYTSLNVRSGPGTSYSVIGSLYNNETVTILGTEGDFYKISYVSNGQTVTGYASTSYIKIVEESDDENDSDSENSGGDSSDSENDSVSNTGGSYTPDADFEEYLESQGFPESYKVELRELHELHPEWIFTAQHTGLDWNTAVKNEMVLGRNLVYKTNPESWKSVEKGAYNFSGNYYIGLDGSSWVAASEAIVSHYMDPRNFLEESTILMFENLSYNSSVQTEEYVKEILKNSFMKGNYTTPDTSETKSYSATFMEAAKASGVSPYHLASRALQEQGTSGTSLSSGTVSLYPGYFNFFNIQAYAANGYTAVQNGAKYASTTNATFMLPWTNQYKSLVGGSIWIGTGYINKGQDTLYLQKFDVVDGGNGYYAHQYMTNVQAAESESKIMKKAYSDEIFSSALEFLIPVFENMPDEAVKKPASTASNNNLLDSITVDGYDISPAFYRYTYNYEITVPANVKSISVSALANHDSATVNGVGEITLKSGENTLLIECVSPSGLVRNYTITVKRSGAEYVKGDVTGDDNVNVNDALTVVRYINGLVEFDDTQLSAGDVTGDEKVNVNDALTIIRYINGFITEL